MFIARGKTGDGEELLILGLSRENRTRLEKGRPIAISQATHGLVIPPGLEIMIFAGETEETMRQELDRLMGPTTIVDPTQAQGPTEVQ